MIKKFKDFTTINESNNKDLVSENTKICLIRVDLTDKDVYNKAISDPKLKGMKDIIGIYEKKGRTEFIYDESNGEVVSVVENGKLIYSEYSTNLHIKDYK